MRKCIPISVFPSGALMLHDSREKFLLKYDLQVLCILLSVRTALRTYDIPSNLDHTSILNMFIYNEVLGLHISTTPLLISSRVLKAAEEIDPRLKLQWDEHGFVCGVSLDIATRLTKALGIKVLSVREFMHLVHRHPQLQSEHFAEWLADTYQLQETVRNPAADTNPIILHQKSSSAHLISSDGSVRIPISRPGWFHLSDIGEDGLPSKLSSLSQSGHWKFWSPESTDHTLGALRGFVSSSGTCSLDLGIPAIAKHPKIMIREVYEKVLPLVTSPLIKTWPIYKQLVDTRDCNTLAKFLDEHDLNSIRIIEPEDHLASHRINEQLIDMKGKKRLLGGSSEDLIIINKDHLLSMLRNSPDDGTIFVMGHEHPDADSIVSAIFEAVRRSLV